MLHLRNAFPRADSKCLEVGYGSLGWLGEFIVWGVNEVNISGIEVNEMRASTAQGLLPMADLRVGDAANLTWADESFQLVVASTVFTSILDQGVRRTVANEITRVLAKDGALLWYDFAFNSPRNPDVRGIGRRELRSLFPKLDGQIRSVTLAPPIARFVACRSWVLATFLEALPFLRTHLIAVLVKTV
jgi:ubiquinone/menaquinone biosynthesis C-methylase UbiE